MRLDVSWSTTIFRNNSLEQANMKLFGVYAHNTIATLAALDIAAFNLASNIIKDSKVKITGK